MTIPPVARIQFELGKTSVLVVSMKYEEVGTLRVPQYKCSARAFAQNPFSEKLVMVETVNPSVEHIQDAVGQFDALMNHPKAMLIGFNKKGKMLNRWMWAWHKTMGERAFATGAQIDTFANTFDLYNRLHPALNVTGSGIRAGNWFPQPVFFEAIGKPAPQDLFTEPDTPLLPFDKADSIFK